MLWDMIPLDVVSANRIVDGVAVVSSRKLFGSVHPLHELECCFSAGQPSPVIDAP